MQRPVINFVRMTGYPILEQLQLEEALLRTTKSNWCLVNDGARQPAIVLGVSGRPAELLHMPEAQASGLQVIKRFTGGGTVVVDLDTIFATLIMQGSDLPAVDCYPQPIMRWTEGLWSTVFSPYGMFRARENDYVFGDLKFGGNAQAITGKRWLHHTSFLWNYDPARMRLLQHPKKRPLYRQERGHEQFVVRLNEILPSRAGLVARLGSAPRHHGFDLQEVSLQEAQRALDTPHLCGTHIIDLAATAAA